MLKTAEDVRKMCEANKKSLPDYRFYLDDANALFDYGKKTGLYSMMTACFEMGFMRGRNYQKRHGRGRAKRPVSSSCGIREEA